MDFHPVWKGADPDIPILKEAKADYAKLQYPGRLGKSLPFWCGRLVVGSQFTASEPFRKIALSYAR